MQLMISVVSESEADEALSGGADILDIKNPAEGSLGAQPPEVIRKIKTISTGDVAVSAAIGDMPNLPGTAALAALGAASCGVDYIKVGLYGSKNEEDAKILLREVQQAVQGLNTSVIAAAYADFRRAGTMNPEYLPQIAAAAGVKGCLVDTAVKDGHSLFDFLPAKTLGFLAERSHAYGLIFGLAGTLCEQDLLLVQELGADVAGIRTAACRDNHRNGPLDANRIRKLRQISRQLPTAGSR